MHSDFWISPEWIFLIKKGSRMKGRHMDIRSALPSFRIFSITVIALIPPSPKTGIETADFILDAMDTK
jgi:hypothetical protein